MSDIQEEQKRLYKRAEENDIKLLKEELEELKIKYQILAHDDAWEIAEYKLRNEKAIEYIKVGKTFDNEDVRKVVNKIQNDLLNILQGKE